MSRPCAFPSAFAPCNPALIVAPAVDHVDPGDDGQSLITWSCCGLQIEIGGPGRPARLWSELCVHMHDTNAAWLLTRLLTG